MALVSWTDEIDDVLGGDLTAVLAYVTPAGGAVVTAVAPIGLRDRDAGTVTFTTSLGFGRKLDRIRDDPRVALAYHARDHGFSSSPRFVLVQGTASVVTEPDADWLEGTVQPQSARFMGPPKHGRLFWDRWLREYYADRVGVHVAVERIVSWLDLDCEGEPDVLGAPLPAAAPDPQAAPKKGAGPRVDVERAAKRLTALPHRLIAWRGADGLPVVVPFSLGEAGASGIALSAPSLPPGGRRAGVLAHRYNAKLIGLATRQHTGWLTGEPGGGRGLYAPHTEQGFSAPANKRLLLLGNGFLAKRNLKRARAAGAAA